MTMWTAAVTFAAAVAGCAPQLPPSTTPAPRLEAPHPRQRAVPPAEQKGGERLDHRFDEIEREIQILKERLKVEGGER